MDHHIAFGLVAIQHDTLVNSGINIRVLSTRSGKTLKSKPRPFPFYPQWMKDVGISLPETLNHIKVVPKGVTATILELTNPSDSMVSMCLSASNNAPQNSKVRMRLCP